MFCVRDESMQKNTAFLSGPEMMTGSISHLRRKVGMRQSVDARTNESNRTIRS